MRAMVKLGNTVDIAANSIVHISAVKSAKDQEFLNRIRVGSTSNICDCSSDNDPTIRSIVMTNYGWIYLCNSSKDTIVDRVKTANSSQNERK